MQQVLFGLLDKMRTRLNQDSTVEYEFTVFENGNAEKEQHLALNGLVGKEIKLHFTGNIFCQNCFKKTKKSYGGGFCYPCTMKLAACDMCILKPEQCHYHLGTCREPSWGEKHCMVEHIVYLANSSGLKVGITRKSQVPIRFMDQGAVEALPIFSVKSRYHSGLIEKMLATELKDKTDWRKMLKGEVAEIDLVEKRDEVVEVFERELEKLEEVHGVDFEYLENAELIEIKYPVEKYPEKITSLSFDKTPTIEGKIIGIKGQYLMLESGVINLRNHTSYEIEVYC